jgi:hypothetical protein
METTTETPTETPVTEEAAKDPNDLGKLTPEEQGALLKIKAESAQYLAKIGEFEVMKARLLHKLNQMDAEGQAIMGAISTRLGLTEGQQWAAHQDGTLHLINAPGGGQPPE